VILLFDHLVHRWINYGKGANYRNVRDVVVIVLLLLLDTIVNLDYLRLIDDMPRK
jgi:hypothetical protein